MRDNWVGDCLGLLLVALCWVPYVAGLDAVPGWDGIGRGLGAGSLAGLVLIVFRRIRRRSRRIAAPRPSSAPEGR